MKIKCLVAFGIVMTQGCNPSKDSKPSADEGEKTEFSGEIETDDDDKVSLPSKISGTNLFSDDPTSYVLRCVTIGDDSQTYDGPIDSQGRFSLQIPKNRDIGCSVIDSADSIVAGLAFGTGQENAFREMDDVLSSSFNIPEGISQVDVGKVLLKTIEASILIPEDSFDQELTEEGESSFRLNQVHDREYSIACSDEDETLKQDCDAVLREVGLFRENTESFAAYFRILKAKKQDEEVSSLSFWRDREYFESCGGFDINAEQKAEIELFEYLVTHAAVGDFVSGDKCILKDYEQARSPGDDPESVNLPTRFMGYFEPELALPVGTGYSVYQEEFDVIDFSTIYKEAEVRDEDESEIDFLDAKKAGLCVIDERKTINLTGAANNSLNAMIEFRSFSANCSPERDDRDILKRFQVKLNAVSDD